ncbi:FKBP-type peptidyl-prolyl cis-trans isomerase [Luteimonas sp. RD2P54]|uniref:Peptidyl-prolyl cis-trans isomerase n=1 Tax=Luteimonas endophytica TaxID=3042023 RepID=A0ABT6JAI4_9GAMM|nr:FKBP-type peptidyl-prolyl cis-trans isomerase [Luteimonas endophytica]MDH5823193.1 FKBP-type peptidyl-prolyl cis-trans isomerase [Luteimonas endophytica]
MTISPRAAPALLSVALLVALAACKPIDQDKEGGGEAEADAAQQNAAAIEVPGLETEKQQVGYAIGLELGATLVPVKDEVDLEAMLTGVRDTLEDKDPRLSPEQIVQVMQGLGERMQARQAARAEEAAAEGKKFLAENAAKPNVQTTESGLQYEVLEQGEGDPPKPGDRVSVHYEGKLLDGTTFDSTLERGQPAMFALDQVVPGWQEGLQLMSPGSRYRLWIPSELGYGEQGTPNGPIGPNATLAFEVELLEVMPAAE